MKAHYTENIDIEALAKLAKLDFDRDELNMRREEIQVFAEFSKCLDALCGDDDALLTLEAENDGTLSLRDDETMLFGESLTGLSKANDGEYIVVPRTVEV